MNLKNDKVLNRLNGLIDQGMGKMQTITTDLEDKFRTEAEAMTRRAQAGFKQGREQFQTAEEVVMRNAKDHPMLFILGALSVIGLCVAISRLFFDQTGEE